MEDNRGTVRVSPELKLALEKRKVDLRSRGIRVKSEGEVIARLLEEATGEAIPTRETKTAYPKPNPRAHELLQRILTEAPSKVVGGIVVNLEQFVEALESRIPSGDEKVNTPSRQRRAVGE